jgi:hypothetical protein
VKVISPRERGAEGIPKHGNNYQIKRQIGLVYFFTEAESRSEPKNKFT